MYFLSKKKKKKKEREREREISKLFCENYQFLQLQCILRGYVFVMIILILINIKNVTYCVCHKYFDGISSNIAFSLIKYLINQRSIRIKITKTYMYHPNRGLSLSRYKALTFLFCFLYFGRASRKSFVQVSHRLTN